MSMGQFKKLSIIIPVFNEERTLSQLISALESIELPLEKEIIIVDDCSTDGSREILYHISKNVEDAPLQIKVVFLETNQGKGAAVRRGFEEVTGDIVLIQGADMEYNPQEYPRLIAPIIEGVADVVYGSRFLEPKNNKIIYRHGYLFSKALNQMSDILSGTHLTDMYTCYKVFSKNAIDQIWPKLKSKRFGIDPELTAWVGKFKFRIIEIPISYTGRTYEEGKKINWKDGLAAIWHIVKFNIFTRK